jgi:hypothetical protein
MSRQSRTKGVRPWTVAIALALAGLAGATGIWFSANAIHGSDRTTVREWEVRAAPIVERTWAVYRELRALPTDSRDAEVVARERSSISSAISAVREDFERLVSVPAILEPIVAEYRSAFIRMDEVVAAAGRLAGGDQDARADLDQALSGAERHLREGDARRERLRARLAL